MNEIKTQEKYRNDLSIEVGNLQQTIIKWERETTEGKTKLEALKALIEPLKQQNIDLETKKKTFISEIADLASKKEQSENELTKLHESLDESRKQIERETRDFEDKKLEAQQFLDSTAVKEEEFKKRDSDLKTLEQTLKDYRVKLEMAYGSVVRRQEGLSELLT